MAEPTNRRITSWLMAGLMVYAGIHVPTTEYAEGDVLDLIRSNVRSDDVPAKIRQSVKKRKDHCDYHGDDNGFFDKFIGWIAFYAASAPFWIPIGVLDDEYSRVGYFPRFPYEYDRPGYMIFDPTNEENVYPYATRLSLEYADDFNDMKRVGGNLVFSTSTRFGVDTEAHFRQESLPASQHDELWTGDFNVIFRFAQSDHVQMRAGLGFNWLDDKIDTDYGFNFTYGGDVMLGSPWIASGVIDVGSLGHATLFHCRATLGVHMHGVEAYTGYDYYSVDSASIDGLVGGIRFWF